LVFTISAPLQEHWTYCDNLVALDTSIRLAILPDATVLGRLVVTTAAARVGRASAAGVATLLSGLMGVDLAMGELASADALVRLAVLAATVVLCREVC
jgi:hypothetical protein